MKRALLNLYRVAVSLRHTLPVILLTLVSLSIKAQCPPIITATPASASVCAGDSVQMVCSPSTGTTWQWYKDGIIMPGETNSTCYAFSDGNYTVIAGGCVFSSNSIHVVIKPIPFVAISSSTTTLCFGQSVTLSVTTGPNATWVWINPPSLFGSSTNPITQSPTITTIYQVVAADLTTNCANTTAVTVAVIPPLVSGTIQSNTQICPGDTPPMLTSTPPTGSNGLYTYQWQMSTVSAVAGFNNIPGANGPTYQPGPTLITRWYRLVTSSPPCPNVNSNVVVVQVNPNPTVTSASTKTICSGSNVNYNPTSNVAGATFTWTASVTSGTVSGFTPSGSGNINDILSVPVGSATSGQVTYVITPHGPAPSSCTGNPLNLVVTVNPTPTVTNASLSQSICAGTTTAPVTFTSNVAATTFTWTAAATVGLSGYPASGSGNLPAMTISSSLMGIGTIQYTVTPHGPTVPSCPGPSVVYTITVNPSPIVTNSPMQQTICTGNTTNAVVLTSNIAATTFTWTATAVPAGISGYQASGTNTIPAQTIINPSNVQGVVTYHIVPSPSINGCLGIPSDYVIYVNPEPVVSVAQTSINLCSGSTTNILLTSNVAGTTFSWTASAPGVITGEGNGSGSLIAQTLINGSNAAHDVIYIITPTANGCVGNPITVTVTVDPAQVLTVIPAAPTICSGGTVVINLVGNVPGITFTWTATAVGNVTGYSNGSGPLISQTLINNDNVIRTVNYAVVMTLNGCSSGVNNFIVTVYPTAVVTNSPLTASRCSGNAFNLALTSNIAGTSYSWTATGTPGILGYSGGVGSTINQTLTNSTTAPGSVIYTITPTANGCPGTPANYTVTVDPSPNVILSLVNQSICSGTNTTQVNFSSSVAGTTYTWTATPSGGGITGYTASGSASIPSQLINSTLSTQGTVTYAVTPSFNGCNGTNVNHIVTINPLPLVTNTPMSQRICTGTSSANVTLQSNVAGTTFSWVATPSSAAITGYLAGGGNTIPPQTLFNSSTTPGTVTYQIIPSSNFGPSCQGTTANYTITVDPSPSISSSLNEFVCSGQPFNYNITSNLAGSTFTWSRAVVPGISNPSASGITATINETLINTTNSDIDVLYILNPIGQAPGFCVGTSSTMTLKVRALPQINAGLDLTIPYGIYTSLNGTAVGGSGALSYTWTPNSFIASGANTLTPQTINLTSSRTYTLTVNDAAGCSASDQMTVFVVGTPIAALPTATPANLCLGQSTLLSANTSGGSGSYTYTWTSIPVGFTATTATVSASPALTTIYTVTANDGFNTSTASVTVSVNPLPTQYSLTGGGSYCIGGSGVIVGLAGSQSGVTYQLYNNSNPVGIPVSGNGASLSFGNQTAAGSYTVTATRTSTGCSQDMGSSVVVTINSLPLANAGIDQIIPYGTSTSLIGSASGGFGTMNYSWNPTTYIASGGNTFSPLTTNLYSNTTFTLIVTDANGCSGTDQVAVSLVGSAINVIATAVPDQICADTTQSQLHAFVTGGAGTYTYLWTCSSDPMWSSTLQEPMISPDVTTNYTVTADDMFNTAIASVTVIVNPMPLLFNVIGGGSYCFAGSGVSIGLSGSQPNTNYQLYRGGVPDGPAITGNGAPISFGNRTAAFNYTVLATNNTTGCSSLMNGFATVTILPPPIAYLVTGGGTYPQGGPGKEVGLMHGDNGISYQLYCNNVAVGSSIAGSGTSINFGYQTLQGTYTVVGTNIVTGCTVDMLGSVSITVLPLPLMFNVVGGGTICQGSAGLFVQLTGSELGINYQLLRNGFPYGALASGTNLPLTWGPFTLSGLFEVRAVNSANGSTCMMNDSAVIIVNPAPTIFTMNPTGSQCPGTILRLNGSDAGIMYYMMLNGVTVDSIVGTGVVGFLDFGPQFTNGTYTMKALNMVTGCQAMMNGSAYINIAPLIFNVLPAGILCPGQVISLSGSEPGVNYQLRRNGTFDMGAPVPGTGLAISLGTISLPGTYSAVAIDATTNCVSYMNDSATLYPDPTAFTIVPDGAACEGDIISLNGSEIGVDYVLLLDNAIHLDTIHGTGSALDFGPQLTAGNYTIIAIDQTSYCQFDMDGTTIMNDSPIKYSVLPAGEQCVGTTISLSGSQPGIFYQLLLDGVFAMGSPVSGTGGAISFGSQSLDGTYTVRAVNTLTGCNTFMSDSTVLKPLPVAFTVLPAGSHCEGTSVGLNGSEINFSYILVLNGTINLDTLAGTGNILDFGPQMTAGTYTIVAYNASTFCSAPMDGNSAIEASPVAYAMTPSGIACKGSVIGLASSETGINYQLRWNGSINIGAPVAGTGSPIDFGPQNLSGIYTVMATNSHGCFSMMSSSVEINPVPVSFNLIPSGTQCQGTALGIDGSEVNANYVLVLNGNVMVDTIPGTGSTISFGPQLTSGNYSVFAYFTATNCQSAMNGNSIISNVAPAIYSMTPAGIICAGTTIGLDNSEVGATYQLRMNGTVNMGAPVTGTGLAISFGVQTLSGVYTVIATNLNGCSSMMSGSVVVNPNPTAFNITPSGGFCPGTVIGVDGSEAGVNYVLILDSAINIDTLAGNGGLLTYGLQTTSGIYTVMAYNATTLCQTMMNGQTIINPSPVAFNMTPAGVICAGATIGLDNSETGVTYQLRLDACINIGAPVAGTGSAITFGTQTLPGTYTIIATNAFNCSSIMNGSIIVNALPIAYNITPSGPQCQGTAIGVDGSEIGVNYILLLNSSISIDTLAGNGASISFGPQFTSGTYTITAFYTASNCQQVMNGITTLNSAPLVFNMTPAGTICSGANLGIDGSTAGVSYQLRRDGIFNIGPAVAGTGSPISFGVQTIPGTYTVEASGGNGCAAMMNGTVLLNASPTLYTQLPSGSHCPGITITLNGSETGMNYILLRDGVFAVDTLAGTGSSLSFGSPLVAGTYTISAYSTLAACQAFMNGNTILLPGPTAYNVTPAGINCAGSMIGLDNSEAGVTYQLRRDGITNVGAPVSGTGSAISFGVVNIPGTYTVIATSSLNGCGATMNGNAVLQPMPLIYSIVAQGIQCAGTSIILNGSQTGTDYVLVLDNIFNLDTLAGTGNMVNFGPQSVTGTYTIQAIGGATTCQSVMNGSTLIIALPAAFNITPAGLTCASAVPGLDGSEAGVNYTLFKNGVSTGITVPGTGSPISFGIQSSGDYTVKAVNLLSSCSNFMPGTLQVGNPPQVNAGSDVTICATQSVMLNATVSYGGATNWSSSGDGTFSNTNTLSAIYLPGVADIAAGTVYILLTADGTGGCAATQVTDTLEVTINHLATANAGNNIDVCTMGDYTITSATASNYTTINWSTSGSGSFVNGNTLTPTYTPSVADFAAGSVNLTMLVTGISPCNNSALSMMVMTFHPLVTANAGTDNSICSANTFTLTDATAANYQNVSWSTSGNGTFAAANTLTPTYTPGAADLTAGSVSLILHVTGTVPCAVTVSDTMTLSFIPAPVSNAGADVPVCENTSLNITDASVANFSSLLWSTSGTGTFSNSSAINPIYIPSAADLASGSVTLTLTVNGNAACAAATDQKIVTFILNPSVNAGADAHMCTTPFVLSGATSANCASVLWTVQTGSGTLSNANTLTPTYTASAADIANGFVILGVTGTPVAPCAGTASDFITLIIDQVPVVNAGADMATCSNSNFTVSDASASLYASLTWTSSGTGTLINATTLNPNYTPSNGDIANGSVTLTLTAANAGCGSFADTKVISFINLTSVNAGPDLTICEGNTVTIGGATANAYSSIFWTTSGSGSFSNATILSPTYTPSLADRTNGSVTLTLNAVSVAPCGNVISDQAILTIQGTPVVWAGNDKLICSTDAYVNNDAFTLNCATLTWTTSGTGTFSNPNSKNNSYTPSAADIANGSVILTLTSTGNAPCADISDQKQISFAPGPAANAGPGATICNTCSFVASAASVQNASSLLWSTSGSGSFNNTSALYTMYSPSAADYAQGSVVLSLTAFSTPPCSQVADTMTLYFSANPGVEFSWGTACEGQSVSFSVNTSITNVGAIATWLWNFGDGNTSNLMNPAHLFAGSGNFLVTLTAIDTTGSARVISHTVTINQAPVSFFTFSTPNCSNAPVNFTDLSHTLYGYISQWIWNYGDGSPADTILFPDDPNKAHLFNATGSFNVTLSITSSAGCMASVTIPVQLTEAPIANFQYTSDCSGLQTSFLDASFANGPGNTVQYAWDFGDPSTGTDNYSDLKDASHIFSAPGTYQVMHIVRNFNNCSDTIVKPVTILNPVPVDFVYTNTCVDGMAYFSPDTSVITMADITAWVWDFGDGVTNSQPFTSHVYSGPGSYQVTLTVTDLSGCTASKTRTLVVNPLPVAMFNTSQLPCEDMPAHFDDVSTTYAGYIVQWNWDFGDGNTQQIMLPANADTDHTYSAPGTYTVKLTILSSDSCTAEREQTIVILPAPVANFDYENACQGTPAKFTDLTQTGGSGIISGWAWNFGDDASGGNNISTLQNPYHTYTTSGTYQVTLTAAAANGCSSTIVKTVVITDAPFVEFSYDNHCVSNPIQFTPDAGVISSDVATWYWSFGDGLTSSASNPQHTYNTPGNYEVSLTITNISGCENTISHTIYILPAPVANFSTSTPACSQHQVDFTNLSSAPVGYILSWEYNFGDGTTLVVNFPENPNVSHTYSTYGNYNVTLTVVTNDNCSSATSRYVQILQSPMANFNSDVNCSGQPAQFSDLSQGNPIAWLWNFGDSGSGANNTSTLQNPVHTYQQAGNYQVSLLVQNANGCQDTVSNTVSIAAKPVVDFSFVNGCAADTVHFISSTFVNVSTTSSWLWQFGDNSTSTEADPYHVYLTPGTYSVSLTITNQNGCTNTKTRQVQVTAAPVAMFTSNSSSCSGTAVLFTDISSSPNGTINTWNWDFGDGTIVTVNAPANPSVSHTYTTAGIFNVVLTIHTTTGCEAYYTTPVTINDASATAFSYQGSCNETPTYFTDLSQPSNGNTIISWAWNFGDPLSGINNTSNLPDPQHLFSGPGTYEVTLTTENMTGCSSSMMQTLTISPEPAVDFIAPPSCLGTPVTFAADPTVTNLSDVAAYLWDFGDGSLPSTLAEPEHLYSQAGTYSVSLTIANLAGCENSIAHTITVHALPVAQFTNSGNCAANLVQFTDISYNPDGEDIVGWTWDFGVGSTTGDTSTLQNPAFIYTSAGTYNVTLTVSSLSGCTDVMVMPVTVIPAPVAQYSYVAEPCHNGSVIFQDESSSPQSLITGWYWEFAPGVYSTLQNPVHVFGSSDSCYNVKLVVTTANGCTDTLIQQVCVPSGLTVTFAYTQTCFGEPTWFTPTLVQPAGSSIAFCNWNFGDPATGIENESKLLNPQHTFSNPGTYIVSLQATDIHNCSTTRYMSVTVDPLPVADFQYKGGSCDSLVSFKNTTTGTAIDRWIWNFGDGSNKIVDAPANPNVIHYYPYPGIYEVTLITLSEAGCSDTITKTIRRTPCISAEIAFSDTIVCQKRSMKFTETTICQAPIASWQWFFGDNTSATYTTQQPYVEHTYANAGKYTVRMVVATQMVGGMVTDTASNQVVVNPAAKAAYSWTDACYGNNTEFQNRSENNNTTIKGYQWNFGDPGSSTDTSSVKHPDYKYDMSGEFDVKLVVTNTLGCTDTIVNKVSLFENPSVDFDWSSSCEAKPVLFSDKSDTTSSAIVNWNWLFSKDGEILGASTNPNCSYSFAQAGIYDAQLKITDRNGCSTTLTKEVAINSSPVAAFSIVENYENKQGQIMLNNGTINGSYYEWDFGNGKTSTGQNPVTAFDIEGSYDIQLITYNGENCADTLTMAYTLMYKGLFVPNAFYPGHMDPQVAVFKPKGSNLKTYYVEVHDRWGNLLWSSSKLDANGSPAEAWDGKLHGNILKQDVYLWKVSATFRDGEVWDGHNYGNNENMPQSKTGTVTLIR